MSTSTSEATGALEHSRNEGSWPLLSAEAACWTNRAIFLDVEWGFFLPIKTKEKNLLGLIRVFSISKHSLISHRMFDF